MSEVFKVRQEAPVSPEIEAQASPPRELASDSLKGDESKASDPSTPEEQKLEIWEGLNRRKFVTEYFDIGNIDGEFNLKMDTSVIDKYVRWELENRKYEKNINNWKEILSEIEEEIGSSRMELFSRIKKIVGYIKAVNRLNTAKEKLKLYAPE